VTSFVDVETVVFYGQKEVSNSTNLRTVASSSATSAIQSLAASKFILR
jgi:hypothetical protein